MPNAWKNSIIVVSCLFEQCLEAVNTLITAWSSEASPFRRLSNHLFRGQSFLKYLGWDTHIFLKDVLNFMHIFEIQ